MGVRPARDRTCSTNISEISSVMVRLSGEVGRRRCRGACVLVCLLSPVRASFLRVTVGKGVGKALDRSDHQASQNYVLRGIIGTSSLVQIGLVLQGRAEVAHGHGTGMSRRMGANTLAVASGCSQALNGEPAA